MTATTPASRFYLLTSEYVGPSRLETPRDVVLIQTEPGRTNQSREARTEGWLGTTNDIATHAHGAYNSLEEAEAAARAKWAVYELSEEDAEREMDADGVVVRVLGLGDHDPRDEWDAAEWIAPFRADRLEALEGLSLDDDAGIRTRAAELVAQATADGIHLDRDADEVADLLREWLQEAQDEADD